MACFFVPKLSGSYVSLHLLCYVFSSLYFPLVSNLIFSWKSLHQHMYGYTICLQPGTHTFPPIKSLYSWRRYWEYTSLSISISFSLPSTWMCVSLSPFLTRLSASSLILLYEMMCTENVLVYVVVLFFSPHFFLHLYFNSERSVFPMFLLSYPLHIIFPHFICLSLSLEQTEEVGGRQVTDDPCPSWLHQHCPGQDLFPWYLFYFLSTAYL